METGKQGRTRARQCSVLRKEWGGGERGAPALGTAAAEAAAAPQRGGRGSSDDRGRRDSGAHRICRRRESRQHWREERVSKEAPRIDGSDGCAPQTERDGAEDGGGRTRRRRGRPRRGAPRRGCARTHHGWREKQASTRDDPHQLTSAFNCTVCPRTAVPRLPLAPPLSGREGVQPERPNHAIPRPRATARYHSFLTSLEVLPGQCHFFIQNAANLTSFSNGRRVSANASRRFQTTLGLYRAHTSLPAPM